MGVIADAIASALEDADHVHGVILSSGANVNLDSPSEPLLHQRADAESATMLRRLIAPGLLRETVIVVLRPAARPVASLFVQAHDNEANCLVNDLAPHGWSLERMRAEP